MAELEYKPFELEIHNTRRENIWPLGLMLGVEHGYNLRESWVTFQSTWGLVFVGISIKVSIKTNN